MKDIRCEVAVFHAQALVEGFEDLMSSSGSDGSYTRKKE